MVAVVDIGNSVISIGAYSGANLLFVVARIGTRDATVDEYAVKLPARCLICMAILQRKMEGAIVSFGGSRRFVHACVKASPAARCEGLHTLARG